MKTPPLSSNEVRRALQLYSAVPVAVILLLAAILLFQVVQFRRDAIWVRQLVTAERLTLDVGTAMLRLESATARGEADQEDIQRLEVAFDALERGVALEPARLARVQQARMQERQWTSFLAGAVDKPMTVAQRHAFEAESHRRLMAVRDGLGHFRGSEIDLLDERQNALMRSSTITAAIGSIGFVLAVGFFILIGWRQLRAVSQYAAELEAANRRLMELDKLKDEFLGTVSHELRTPLNAVLGFGTVIEDGIAGPLNNVQQEYLGKMLGGAQTLLGLIDDLLDMGRIEAGRFDLVLGPVNLDEVCQEVTDQLQPLADRKGLALSCMQQPELPLAQGDRRRVVQVLTNLVGNAIKFTPAGGSVTVRLYEQDHQLRCEVQDTGPGIHADDIPRLFKRFGQLSTGNTRAAGGTGLGLAIARAIVTAHRGDIGVSSTPNEGSTFWFTLPLYTEAVLPG